MRNTKLKYRLDSKCGKFTCPGCGRHKKFVAYVATASKEPVNPKLVGKCDRIYNCGYHLTPYEYFKHKPRRRQRSGADRLLKKIMEDTKKEIFEVCPAEMEWTLRRIGQDPLCDYLTEALKLWDVKRDTIRKIFALYRATKVKAELSTQLFWLTNFDGTVCDGKMMAYDPATGKRIKEPCAVIDWVSSRMAKLRNKKYEPTSKPFFGEHLLALYKPSKVFVVESEKTALTMAALIAEHYGGNPFSKWLFIASGGLQALTMQKIEFLKKYAVENRARIVFIPDAGPESENAWYNKTRGMGNLAETRRLKDAAFFFDDFADGDDIADCVYRLGKDESNVIGRMNFLNFFLGL